MERTSTCIRSVKMGVSWENSLWAMTIEGELRSVLLWKDL